jgi:hypothetical protein
MPPCHRATVPRTIGTRRLRQGNGTNRRALSAASSGRGSEQTSLKAQRCQAVSLYAIEPRLQSYMWTMALNTCQQPYADVQIVYDSGPASMHPAG